MTSGDNNINKSGKFDLRIGSRNENQIGQGTRIHGISIIGDDSSDNNDNTVLPNSNNTESNNKGRGNENLIRLLEAGFQFSSVNELDCRVDSGDRNNIGAHCEIKGHSIVGDRSRNNTMYKSVLERNNTMKESVAESRNTVHSNEKNAAATTSKGGGNNSNNILCSNNRPRKF